MKIFISGPISSLDKDIVSQNISKFEEKVLDLREDEYVVLSPSFLPKGLTQEAYMDICLAMVRSVDILYMLEGWDDSSTGGAAVEHAYALKLNKIIVYQSLEFEL